MQAWKRFRALGGRQRRIALESVLGLTISWLALRLAGFRRSSALLAGYAPGPTDSPPSVGSDAGSNTGSTTTSGALPPDEIARLTQATARYLPFASNCLDRSLAICWLLRRRGLAARLRIGARKDGARLEAHAWVELAGVPLGDVDAHHQHYVPFDGGVASFEGGAS